jgi:actin-related protein 5
MRIQLDEEALKEKKKQKLLKAGFDARLRAKKEKEREKEEREAEERKEVEERQMNLSAWVEKTRKQQEV